MIELNEKTQQDFLNREWVQQLLDAGVDMSDAKYYITTLRETNKEESLIKDIIVYKDELDFDAITKHEDANPKFIVDRVPTYTVSELLYKLHEWIYPTINGEKYSGGLSFIKDAPFYMWYYKLVNREKWYTTEGEERTKTKSNDNYIYAEAEYPIESLASVLIQCHRKDIGFKNKNIDISDK